MKGHESDQLHLELREMRAGVEDAVGNHAGQDDAFATSRGVKGTRSRPGNPVHRSDPGRRHELQVETRHVPEESSPDEQTTEIPTNRSNGTAGGSSVRATIQRSSVANDRSAARLPTRDIQGDGAPKRSNPDDIDKSDDDNFGPDRVAKLLTAEPMAASKSVRMSVRYQPAFRELLESRAHPQVLHDQFGQDEQRHRQ